jgi:hypothetical protein
MLPEYEFWVGTVVETLPKGTGVATPGTVLTT